MQNRLVRSRGTTRYFVTCALGIGATENPKLSLLYVLILCSDLQIYILALYHRNIYQLRVKPPPKHIFNSRLSECNTCIHREQPSHALGFWLTLFFMSRAHSPNFPSLYLRQNSFSNPSVALPTSQLILQPFRCFTYVTVHSPTLPSLHLGHS